MSKNKRKLCSTLERFCKEKYNKYGFWEGDTYLTYDDMEEM